MDIYTTSFCLPRPVASSTDLSAIPSSSFELPPTSPLSPRHPQARRQSHQASLSDGAVAAASPAAGSTGTVSTNEAHTGAAARGHSTSSSVGSAGAPGSETTTAVENPANGATNKDDGASSMSSTAAAAAGGDGLGAGSSVGSSSTRRTSVDFDDAMQRLCVETMAAHQCIASFSAIEPTSPVVGAPMTFPPSSGSQAEGSSSTAAQDRSGKLYNVHLSGGYQQVMAARGHILRESPFLVRT